MKQDASVELTGGKRMNFETGRLAKQAPGAAVVRIGDNVVLATAVAAAEPREGQDFFPLTVDYREYTYAGGRIPGGFIKREGRPSEREILISRMIDRPCRPLFPEGFRNETQIISLVLSADNENDPDVCAINGASAALTMSEIPFGGPIGAVRVGRINEEFVLNPTYTELADSDLNIMVVGTKDGIVMVEAGAKGVTEDVVAGALDFAHTEIKKICAAISDLAKKVGKQKMAFTAPAFDENYYKELFSKIGAELADATDTKKYQKKDSYSRVADIKKKQKEAIGKEDAEALKKFSTYFEAMRERIFREQVTKNRRRPDSRQFDEIRPITVEVGVLPRPHGSALFTRGETQALVTTTLGTSDD